ncbi:hypothetical protein Glove_212g187 [Diversispora epigaea]|uniref:Uncharacterized protein n=1 Tax=Diversispora epigaea TaxID=1348612 RepID=A0A397IMW7_9GLOM|nr:hypothetical protein Glove_212g187 [Diversispora epigaea]
MLSQLLLISIHELRYKYIQASMKILEATHPRLPGYDLGVNCARTYFPCRLLYKPYNIVSSTKIINISTSCHHRAWEPKTSKIAILTGANESRLLERPESPEPANELTEGDSSAGRQSRKLTPSSVTYERLHASHAIPTCHHRAWEPKTSKIAILPGANESRLLERPESPEPANELTEGDSSAGRQSRKLTPSSVTYERLHASHAIPTCHHRAWEPKTSKIAILPGANESRLLERPESPEPANELTEGDSSAGRQSRKLTPSSVTYERLHASHAIPTCHHRAWEPKTSKIAILPGANESRLLERPESPEPANELTEGDSSAGRQSRKLTPSSVTYERLHASHAIPTCHHRAWEPKTSKIAILPGANESRLLERPESPEPANELTEGDSSAGRQSRKLTPSSVTYERLHA